MTGNGNHNPGERLDSRSRMSELAKVPSWIERLASYHPIPPDMQFAMNLCLEEVLSNIIRHGYVGQADHSIGVRFSRPRSDYYEFVIEDEAPPFNPVAAPELPPISEREDVSVGWQGLRLLRRFADALEYQATPTGNRLSIGFTASGSTARL